MAEPPVLHGYRRDLTKEGFEELVALQCSVSELLGHVGTTLPRLEGWCKRVYHRPFPEVIEAVRQDGLIQIRRASFDQLKKSATIITQQYNRFLPPPRNEEDNVSAALAALTAAVRMPEAEIQAVFQDEEPVSGDEAGVDDSRGDPEEIS